MYACDIILNYRYISYGSYLQDATKKEKCAIRKREKQYRVQDGQLCRVICTKSKKGDALSLKNKLRCEDKEADIFNGCHIGPAGLKPCTKVAIEHMRRLHKSISGPGYQRMGEFSIYPAL